LADQQLNQLQTEDWILFLSTVLGSAGMVSTSNPQYMLYGLAVGAASKALLSLGPNWRRWEDWLLFAGTFLGALGMSLSNNSQYILYGLILGAIGKSQPSLVNHHSSLEDWLLFLLPLVTGIMSALTSNPNYAMTGLFFGMLGKSLGSVNPNPPSSGLRGNRNYVLWNNCRPLVNPSVRFTARSDIRANGNWDLQVNAYAPSGADAYMQFVIAVTTSGEVQWSIENWPIAGDNLFNTCSQHLFQLPSAFLENGYSIGLKMNTDPNTNNVTSLDFSVSDASGAMVAAKHVALDSSLPLCSGSWNDSYLSQVIGFEPNIVGYNGGAAVTFFSGCTGVLECSADAISANSSIPSCAETKAGTVEDSNMSYSAAVQASPGLVTIGTAT
jgi:hypothetical protein